MCWKSFKICHYLMHSVMIILTVMYFGEFFQQKSSGFLKLKSFKHLSVTLSQGMRNFSAYILKPTSRTSARIARKTLSTIVPWYHSFLVKVRDINIAMITKELRLSKANNLFPNTKGRNDTDRTTLITAIQITGFILPK